MLRQLKNNLSFSFEIPALDRDGVETYVEHRLVKAGYNGPHMFSKSAIDLLYKGSQGIPRLINVLSHKALMVAYGKGEQIIDESHIDSAIKDTESARQSKSLSQRLFDS